MQDYQITSKIHPKQHVKIKVKTDDTVREPLYEEGVVQEILTETETHYRGIKVRLTSGTIGRVCEIIKNKKK